jgi:hypothetical protein
MDSLNSLNVFSRRSQLSGSGYRCHLISHRLSARDMSDIMGANQWENHDFPAIYTPMILELVTGLGYRYYCTYYP